MVETQIIDILRSKVEGYSDVESVVGPWSDQIDPRTRAQVHRDLLGTVYGQGHPALSQPIETLIGAQKAGEMLTWLMYVNGKPVGMANIEVMLEAGLAELCRTVKLPEGTYLPDGTILNGRVNNTVVMYQRLLDFLGSPIANQIWALQADLRLAKTIILPDGSTLEAGGATQHINEVAGLKPWLLCVPRFQVHPPKGNPHQEAFLQSRLYLQPEHIDTSTPLYSPQQNISGSISLSEIARATYERAFAIQPYIINSDKQNEKVTPKLTSEATAGIHFSTIFAEGNVNSGQLIEEVQSALKQSRFVEIVIPNHPGNIQTQESCYEVGLIPLGVFPGGRFRVNGGVRIIPTTFHFGTARYDIRRQIVDIELARDYRGSRIEELTYRLHQQW